MRLLPVLVDLVLLVLDRAFTLLQLVLHRLNMLLFTVGVGNLSVKILVLLADFLLQCIHLLFLVPELILDQRQLTLHLHTVINVPSQVTLVLLLYLFDLIPSLVFNTFALLFMALNHLLDLHGQGLLFSLFLLAFQNLITITVFHQALMRLVSLAHQLLELFQVFLFLLKQTLVAFSIRSTLFFLVLLLFLQLIVMLLAPTFELLTIVVAHLTPLNLDLLHLSVALDLLFLHLTCKVFHTLLIAGK